MRMIARLLAPMIAVAPIAALAQPSLPSPAVATPTQSSQAAPKGYVDSALAAASAAAATAQGAANTAASGLASEISRAQAAEALRVLSSAIGAAGGVAPLNGSSLVPVANLPAVSALTGFVDPTNGSNITSGTVSAARLPNISAITGAGAAATANLGTGPTNAAFGCSTAPGATTCRSLQDIQGDTVNVAQFMPAANGVTLYSPVTAYSGNQTVTISGASFTQGDVGKPILIEGIGAAGAPLLSSIGIVFSPTSIAMPNPAGVNSSTSAGQLFRIDYGTDDSAKIKAAHDLAVSTGKRYVYFPSASGNYFAPTLSASWDAIFVGDGKLTGTYKQQITPLSAATRAWFPSPSQPSQSLTHLTAAMAASTANAPAIIVTLGTSRSTVSATNFVEDGTFHDEVRRRLAAEFPTAHFTVIDRGIGGSTTAMLNGASVSGATIPYWYTNTASPWLPTYVQPLLPDAVFALIGVNDGFNLNPTDLRGFVSTIKGWSHAADVVLCPDNNTSMQYNSAPAYQEGFDYASGLIRTYARKNGYAVADVYRLSLMLREGFDPDEAVMFPEILTPAGASTGTPLGLLPITFPRTRDFALGLNNITGYNFWQHTPMAIQIGNNVGNTLVLEKDSGTGNIAYTVNLTSSITSIARTVTSIAAPAGGLGLEINVRGGNLFVYINTPGVIFSGPIERFGGLFTPSVTFADGQTSGATITFNSPKYTPYMPSMTDLEMYGSQTLVNNVDPVWGGNGVNHLGILGVRRVLGGALDLTRFAN